MVASHVTIDWAFEPRSVTSDHDVIDVIHAADGSGAHWGSADPNEMVVDVLTSDSAAPWREAHGPAH